MPSPRTVAVSLFVWTAAASWAHPRLVAQEPAATPLFDGKTLAGWDGDPAVWSVRDGTIVGSTVGAPIAHNTFLVLQGDDVVDFEFACEVRLEGDNNSGVQYRSRHVEPGAWSIAGYQCDVHADPRYLGMLYEEKGGGIVATHGQRVARGADGSLRVLASRGDAGAVDLARWHSLRIEARGNTLRHWIDGKESVEFVDDASTAARRGNLALQVHAGPPMTVYFRNLSLRRLPTEEVAKVAAAAATAPKLAVPQWIWDASAQDGEEVFFRRVFALPAAPRSAMLAVTCDNHCRVYVNGEKVAQSDAWERPRFVDVGRLLRAGDNAIAVHGWNDGGVAGVCAELDWTLADGAMGQLVSDGAWRCGADDPDRWEQAGFDDAAWTPATVLAPLGAGPWSAALAGDAFAELRPDPAAFVPAAAPELQVRDGWRAERLLAAPRSMGSWVAMCADDRGRLYASDQNRGLYRITLPAEVAIGGEPLQVERIDVALGGCQGLCWAFGALYAVQSGGASGLYRVTDRDGDDRLDTVERLRALDGSGEHGPHAVVPAPDGEHLLVLCGNHVKVPELARSRVPTNWRDDALLPRIDDPNGHAVGIEPPGGYVCQVDRDGKEWELVCCGFRNAYDLAVLASGEVVTYDADMEWDMGLPWYRPTRICLVQSGVDYGWRNGSVKWRSEWPDTLPALFDIGPGSPTGMVAGEHGALALDWTFGIAHEVDLAPAGATFAAQASTFVAGQPLPLTDVLRVGPAPGEWAGTPATYYLLTGGRGVPSRLYRVTPDAAAPGWRRPPAVLAERDARRRLEACHGRVDAAAIAAAWPALGHADAAMRYAARIAVESQPVATWRQRALEATPAQPWSALTALLALARQGEAADLQPLLAALARFEFATLDHGQRLAWLRVHSLGLQRLGPCGPDAAQQLGARLLPLFPSGDDAVDGDLAALLAFLEVPGLLDRAVPMLSPMRPAAPPPWSEIVERNASYGGAIAKMLGAMPPTAQLAIADAVRTVKNGWTEDLHRQVFAFLAAARKQQGGASYDGYLQAMVDAVWSTCSDDEQRDLRALAGKDEAAAAARAPVQATPPKGPGRHWQLAEAQALVRGGLGERDLAAGKNLFFATGCAACHRFAGTGGGVGPDLTSLANKFRAADVLEAVLEPSKVVSDQYSGSILTRTDGSTLFGRVSSRTIDGVAAYEVVTATVDAALVRVPAAEVQKVEPAPLSPMPAGLVDGCSEPELLDLLAYLLSRGS